MAAPVFHDGVMISPDGSLRIVLVEGWLVDDAWQPDLKALARLLHPDRPIRDSKLGWYVTVPMTCHISYADAFKDEEGEDDDIIPQMQAWWFREAAAEYDDGHASWIVCADGEYSSPLRILKTDEARANVAAYFEPNECARAAIAARSPGAPAAETNLHGPVLLLHTDDGKISDRDFDLLKQGAAAAKHKQQRTPLEEERPSKKARKM